MSMEKRWNAVPATAFTSNGTIDGIVTVSSTKDFYVKQNVFLRNNLSNAPAQLQIKSVISDTQLIVGLSTTNINTTSDISTYTTAAASTIEAPLQNRPSIPQLEYTRAVYEEEPVVAIRTTAVDPLGEKYSLANPMPVLIDQDHLNVEIINANLNVQLTAKDNDPLPGDIHDSIRVGDGTNELKVNADGSLTVVLENNITVGNATNIFNSVSSVVSGITTNLISYTVPSGNSFKLCNIEVGGSNIAQYDVFINGLLSARKRTWFSGPFTENFLFETNLAGGVVVATGQVILVQVTHNRPDVGDFEGRILGELIS